MAFGVKGFGVRSTGNGCESPRDALCAVAPNPEPRTPNSLTPLSPSEIIRAQISLLNRRNHPHLSLRRCVSRASLFFFCNPHLRVASIARSGRKTLPEEEPKGIFPARALTTAGLQ